MDLQVRFPLLNMLGGSIRKTLVLKRAEQHRWNLEGHGKASRL